MSSAYGRRALDSEEAKVRRAEPGERNDQLVRSAFACGQLVAGGELDDDTVEEALVDAAIACGLRETEAVATVRSGMAAGKERPRHALPRIASRPGAVAWLEPLEKAARDRPWPGHAGAVCCIVMLALLYLGREHGGHRRIPAGVNRIAAITGLTPSRVSNALKTLRDEKLVCRVRKARNGNPNHYNITLHLDQPPPPPSGNSPRNGPVSRPSDDRPTITLQGQSTPPLTSPPIPDKRESDPLDPSHDAYRRGAIGETGWLILHWLHRNPGTHTQIELSTKAGPSIVTVSKHLRPASALVRFGLVERTSAGSVAAGPLPDRTMLDQIALEMKTAGSRSALLAKMRTRYQQKGKLDSDGWWLGPNTRARTKATWLVDPSQKAGIE